MISIDVPQVIDEATATSLMIHHLALAAAYFEATHDDRGRYANEKLQEAGLSEGTVKAASSFIDVLCSYYEDLGA